jgi:alpha-1,2-mannosyltransferase
MIVYLDKIWTDYAGNTTGRPPGFGDFFALWSYGRIAGTHSAAEIYDFATLHDRQVGLGMEPAAKNPFPYPPTFLLLLAPLGRLPYLAAYLLWMAGTVALFVWAVIATCSRLPLCVFGALVAPVSVVSISSGQSGFLAGALMTAGIRLARPRPIVAGILLGLLSYKPQLGLLVPVALTSAGLWTTFVAAGVAVAGLALAATLAYGWAAWPAWIAMLPAYAQMFDRSKVQLQFMPTVLANLRQAGWSLPAADLAQAVVSIAVAVFVARCFRRRPDPQRNPCLQRNRDRLAAAALLAGTFLATPHVFLYDMPMLVAAIALFIEDRIATTAVFSLAEILVLILATLFPLVMVSTDTIPIGAVSIGLLFSMIVIRHGTIGGGKLLSAG